MCPPPLRRGWCWVFPLDVDQLAREAYGDLPASAGESLDALHELGAALGAPTPLRPPKWSPWVGTGTAASSTIGATEGSQVLNGVRAQALTSTPASSAACADAKSVNASAQLARSFGVNVTTTVAPGGDPAEQEAHGLRVQRQKHADPVAYDDPDRYAAPVDEHVGRRGHPAGDGAAGQVDPHETVLIGQQMLGVSRGLSWPAVRPCRGCPGQF